MPSDGDIEEKLEGGLKSFERSRRWREVFTLYLMMTLGTLVLDQLARAWSPLASVSVLLVALGFIFLPTEWLIRRGESPLSFGIGGRADLESHQRESLWRRSWRSCKQALWISLLVFPLFIVGTHAWRTWQGQEAHFEHRAFTRWGEMMRGSSTQKLPLGELNVGARSDNVILKWQLKPNERELKVALSLDHTKPRIRMKTRGVKLIRAEGTKNNWVILGGRSGTISLDTTAERVVLKGQVDGRPLSKARYSLGEYREGITSDSEVVLERDLSWLWSIFFMQLFLVGLPEEIFYRGYLQTRLDSLVGRDRLVFGVHYNWHSALLCSALFAIAHLVTILHPSRLAVFFPSLLFAWMRRAYHDTLSPAIFHALCNLLSQILWGIYALSV